MVTKHEGSPETADDVEADAAASTLDADAWAAGGDYAYYLDMGGQLGRIEWEYAGYPATPAEQGR